MALKIGKERTVQSCLTEAHPFRGISAGFNDAGVLGALGVTVPVVFDDGTRDTVTVNLLEGATDAQAIAMRAAWTAFERRAHQVLHG